MANYIQLFSKVSGKPEAFQVIDKKLCAALGVFCDENRYYCSWYDIIGYSGVSDLKELIEKIQKNGPDAKLLTALKWLDQHYSLNTWHSR